MPHSRTLPTPSLPHPKNGLTFYGAATLQAPSSLIWSTLIDFPSYPHWNRLTPHPSAPVPPPSALKPGLEIIFTAPPKDLRVRITEVVEGKRLCWVPLGGRWAMRRERVIEVVDFEDGLCEVRAFETVVGWGAGGFARWGGGKGLDRQLKRWAEDLGGEVGRRLGREGVVNPERREGEGWVGDEGDDGDEDDDEDDGDERDGRN